ncbi:patatin-like phospholipase family protein [Piscinibacter sakaiensis]|uniref:patatin-like phospholipase family protein n=1 Tax=Piscinibacter sakaiensis TaxID=1547922 RepID=UPI003AAF0271
MADVTAGEADGAAAPALSRRRLLAAAATGWLSGCTFNPDADHSGADAPRSAPLQPPPALAWVLSSGGPRGFVHVGVVKALAEMQLKPDLIVGASVGALVAVMYASGMPIAELETLALDLQPWELAGLAIGGDQWFSGEPLADLVDHCLRERVGQPLLERLPLPAVCAAQRLADGEVVGFNHGRAGLAVQAAGAIVGRFVPVHIRGQRYADADLVMPLPVRLARQFGAGKVLAVDASAYEDRAPAGTEKWRAGDLRKRALTRPDAELADLLLHPDTGYYAGTSRDYREHSIAIGYRTTMAARERIVALHRR